VQHFQIKSVIFASQYKILFGFTEMSQTQKKSLMRYLMPAMALGVFAFLMVAYGSAYTPPKAQKQRIVCFKFKQGTSQEEIKKHLTGFQDLKRELPEIASYSAGETFNESNSKAEYDVMHYLTFRTDAEVEKFRTSPEYQAFQKANEANWEKTLVINSEIK
jgi:multidrug efflux pump subunit AcrB